MFKYPTMAKLPSKRVPALKPPADGLLSIGALSAATGVPVETIRTWERRYGYPRPERKPSGHRVYPLVAVPRLRRMAEAIARGHRAAEVVGGSDKVLDALLRISVPPAPLPAPSAAAPPPASSADLLARVTAFDGEALKRAFHRDWAMLGPLAFLATRASPFLTAVGEAWADGKIDVRHEHFASAALGDFLRAVRLPLDERATGPIVVLATLPGEPHTLGLEMAALVLALAGWRVLYLGAETPPEQVTALAHEAPLRAVALSIVDPRTVAASIPAIEEMRRLLPRDVTLVLGGAAAESAGRSLASPGVLAFADLPALDGWARAAALGRA